jgi:HEAT repeat protein
MASAGDIGIFTTDRTLVVRTWDAALEAMTGITAQSAIGRPVTDVIPTLQSRGLVARLEQVLSTATAQVLAPALHHFLIPCPPRTPTAEFDRMQQRVTINPLREGDTMTGLAVVIEDVTARLTSERALARAVGSEDWRARQSAVEQLAKTADESLILALVENIRRNHRNFSLLSGALRLLETADVNVTRALLALLDDPEPDLRIQVALALGEQRDPAATDALIRALDDEHANVRFQAIESLGRLRAAAAVDKLLQIVAARDFYLSFAALDALTVINDARVAPSLVPLVDDPLLRVPIADALAVLGDERVITPLVNAINSSRRDVGSLVQAIVRIHDRFEREYHDGGQVVQNVRDTITADGRQHVLHSVAQASGDQLAALARMLGWLRGDDVARALASLLAQPTVRAHVIEGLVRHGEGVVDLLLEQLNSDDADVRLAAITALGRVGSRRATEGLLALLDEPRDLLVAAAGALARIGDPRAFGPLLTLLDHDDAAVRQSAIGALNSIGHPELSARARELLRHSSPHMRESAVRIVGYFGHREGLDDFLACATDPDESVRRAVVEHLPFIEHPDALETLIRAVRTDTASVRAAAARALRHVDDRTACDTLRDALSDTDHWVRYYAARALAEQRDTASVDRLLHVAQHDPAMQVRIAAIDALGELATSHLVGELRALSAHDSPEIGAAALRALGRVATSDVLPELQRALRHAEPARRHAAVAALAAHGSADAATALAWAAAADPDASVADAAADALRTIAATGHAVKEAIEALLTMLGDGTTHERAVAAIVQLPASRLEFVGLGLEHPHPLVRRGTVETLGRIQRVEATRLVERALGDESPHVREAAVTTLARLGSRSADEVIARLASQDPSKAVRRAAAAALARARGLAKH